MQNQPGSDLDGLVRFSLDTSGLEARCCVKIMGPVLAECNQFPHFQTRLHSSTDGPDHIVQNQHVSELV